MFRASDGHAPRRQSMNRQFAAANASLHLANHLTLGDQWERLHHAPATATRQRRVARRPQQLSQQPRIHHRHVAAQKDCARCATAFESGKNSAERPAPRHRVTANHSHGCAERRNPVADEAHKSLAVQTQPGFVAAHARRKAAGENKDGDVACAHTSIIALINPMPGS